MTGPSYRGLYCFWPQTMVGVLTFPFPDENIQSLERLLKGHGKPSGYPFMGERRIRLFGSRPHLTVTANDRGRGTAQTNTALSSAVYSRCITRPQNR